YYVALDQLMSVNLDERSPVLLILSVVVAAAVEEIFFRGFLYTALERSVSPLTAVAISALLFGLLHVVTGGAFGAFRFWPSVFMGVLLGLLRMTSGSVWPGLLLHALHNALLQSAPLMGFTKASQFPEPWLWTSAGALVFGSLTLAWMAWEQ